MAETSVRGSVATSVPAKANAKKAVSFKKAKPVAKKVSASHPPTAAMVKSAIKSQKERGGSSLQAIKKYISVTYKIDAEKLSPFIRKYLKSAADNGALIRTKGKGASGSFKLAVGKAEGAKKVVKKSGANPKSAIKPKKSKGKSAKSGPQTAKTKAARKSPSIVKKAAKAPATRKPKPKKATSKKVVKKVATKN